MKGPAKLSLAIAMALAGGNVFALGLGTIQVTSRLNQPLSAEIPVMADSPAEVGGLSVALASAEDFQRVGLDRSRVDVPLQFAVGKDSRGQTVIKVTTHDPVREPLVDFLISVNWSKGRLLREYTVLLDPPVTAPAVGHASVSPAHEAPRAAAQALAPEHAPVKPKSVPVAAKPPRAEAERARPVPTSPAVHAASAGEYGPVAAGETLSEIAGATRPDDNTNINAMMLALLKANPDAFFRDNINALKRGAILRIPSHDEIRAAGTAAAVAAAVREQNQDWATNAPVAKPTLIARTGAPVSAPAPTASSRPTTNVSGSHLALVPPRAGKGGQNSSDHPGASSGSGNSQTAAELARTKEALTSREQEVGELKSRVKDLEKINGDNSRLLTLKQNEIAELQNKLKQLQAEAAAKPVAPAPVTSKPASIPTVVAKAPEAKPAGTESAQTAGDKSAPKLTAKDIWGSIGSDTPKPGSTSTTDATNPPTTPATPPPATPAAADASTPAAETAPPPAVVAPEAAKPAEPVSKPIAVKTNPAPQVTPLAPPDLPWWQNNNVLLGGGAALLIIGLLALMRFMRKPKPATVAASTLDSDEEHLHASGDEQRLLDELAHNPVIRTCPCSCSTCITRRAKRKSSRRPPRPCMRTWPIRRSRNGSRFGPWASICVRTIRCSARKVTWRMRSRTNMTTSMIRRNTNSWLPTSSRMRMMNMPVSTHTTRRRICPCPPKTISIST